jgi:hypothetical protein
MRSALAGVDTALLQVFKEVPESAITAVLAEKKDHE